MTDGSPIAEPAAPESAESGSMSPGADLASPGPAPASPEPATAASGALPARLLAALRASAPVVALYGFYLCLAVWTFRPALAVLETALIGKPDSDVLRNAWGFWWFKAMLFERFRFPAYTTYLNFPRGMLILLIDPLNCLLSVPLQALFGLPTAYNLYVLAVVAFSGTTAALFARYITGSMGASLVAGVVYAYAPYVLSSSLSGNSEVVNVGWIPLFLLYFLRALQGGPRRDGLLAGAMLVCTTLSSWYYGYIAALFSAVYAIGWLAIQGVRRRPVGPSIRALGWAVLVFGVFSAVMVGVYREIIPSVQKGVAQGNRDQLTVLAGNAVNLWDMYRPSPDRWHRPSLFHLPVELLLALPIALVLGIRRAWSWALVGLLGLLLAMSLRVQTHPVELRAELWSFWERLTTLSSAVYAGFLAVPFSGVIRFPARFLVMVHLAAGVVLACGLRTLFVDRTRLQPVWIALGALASIWLTGRMIDVARFHEIFVVTPVPPPKHVQLIAADPDFVAVVNLPTDLQGRTQLYYQTVHQKPLLNYVDFVTSRLYYINDLQIPLSFSDAIYAMQQRGWDDHTESYPTEVPAWPTPERSAEQLASLKKAGLRYIVVERKKFKPESLTGFEALVKPQVEKLLSDEGVDLYRLK